MPAQLHDVRFPNESAQYRAARDRLLESEMALRRQLEEVAAERRKLPLGGAVKEDYLFDEVVAGAGRQTRFSELFQDGKDTLIVYSFMYPGHNTKEACPACTSILDGLEGESPHVRQRVNFAVVAKSPIQQIREHATKRGWRNLRLLSSGKNTYNADYHGEDAKGNQLPALNVFVKKNGKIHHTYCTELLYAKKEPGQDGRHVDLIWPIWNLFDCTPEGRGDWYPKLEYADQRPLATLQHA